MERRGWRGEQGGDLGEEWKPEGWLPSFDEDEVLPRLPDQYPPLIRGLLNDPADWRESVGDEAAPPPWVPTRWRPGVDRPAHFGPEALEWLTKSRFALRSTVPRQGRGLLVWRVTAAGAVVIALDWAEP
jgi:hypothetical protein